MKRINQLLLLAAVIVMLSLSSCVSTKHFTYFHNIDTLSLVGEKYLHDNRIMQKDQLFIFVSTTDPVASQPFNLRAYTGSSSFGTGSSNTGSLTGGGNGNYITYLVENDGTINYPVFGKIKVLGLTNVQLQELLEEKLKSYFKDTPEERPIVTVRTANWRVVMLGEIGPTVVTSTNESLSIFEALAKAGDMSLYGKRYNVLIIRQLENGEKVVHRMNLHEADVLKDPYYYLQQNDIVYVEPTKNKTWSSDWGPAVSIVISAFSFVTSLATMIITLAK